MSEVVYQLELPPQWKIHNVFHTSLLTPYTETDLHGPNYLQPPPDIVEGEPEFEVERILKSRRMGKNKTLQYLIRWKGYSQAHDSWEPAKQVHAPELVRRYLMTQEEGSPDLPISHQAPSITKRYQRSHKDRIP